MNIEKLFQGSSWEDVHLGIILAKKYWTAEQFEQYFSIYSSILGNVTRRAVRKNSKCASLPLGITYAWSTGKDFLYYSNDKISTHYFNDSEAFCKHNRGPGRGTYINLDIE